MIEIKNISTEPLLLKQTVDVNAPGCRIRRVYDQPPVIEPGHSISFMGYEPGVSFSVTPVTDQDRPRSLLFTAPDGSIPSGQVLVDRTPDDNPPTIEEVASEQA